MSARTRYRCSACGNLTRFDVVATRRVREFQHYTVGGQLAIDDEELIEEAVESVTCRWCGASGESIETVAVEELGTRVEELDSEGSS
jgi:hypothetical protein